MKITLSVLFKIIPLLVVTILMTSSSLRATSDTTFTLTQEMIQSSEKCYKLKKTVQLNCPSYQQTTSYTCGPATVMSLMSYYGKLNSFEMNQTTEMLIAKEMGTTKEGTSLAQLETWLKNNGFSVQFGYRINTDTLIKNIQKGMPTLVGYSNHWLLAIGYKKGDTPNADEVIFADSCNHITTICRDNIDSMWIDAQLSRSHCRNNGEYIVAIPRNSNLHHKTP